MVITQKYTDPDPPDWFYGMRNPREKLNLKNANRFKMNALLVGK